MRPRSRTRRPDRGFALIALLALLAAGVLYFVVTSLSPQVLDAYRTRKTEKSLSEARDALLGYAVKYRDVVDPTAVYGYLPLPDLGYNPNLTSDYNRNNNVGCAGEGCDAAQVRPAGSVAANYTVVGRFPWRLMGTEPIKDGYGECLWYAVSGSHKRTQPISPMNWDTLGQLDVVVANSTNSLGSVLASVHDRPVAIIFSPGPPLPGQNRAPDGNNDVTQCEGNYDVAQYLGPDAVGGLNGVTNYFGGSTNNASADTSGAAKALSTQGAILKRTDNTLWPNACPSGTNCTLVANDKGLALTADTLFGALRKSSQFQLNINSMLGLMVSCLRDQIAAGSSFVPDPITGYTPPIDKSAGRIRSGDTCFNNTPPGYFTHWRDMFFVAKPSVGNFTVTVDTVPQNCAGVLIFAGQRGAGQSRANPAEQSTLANYLEGINLTSFTMPGAGFAGQGLFGNVSATQSAQQDIVRCIPNTASFVTTTSPILTPGQQLANYDPGTRTLSLGNPEVTTNNGFSGSALFGCAWMPEAATLGKGFRAYFQLQFKMVGTSVGDNGFVFIAADAESNNLLSCGASGSHLGYYGNNGVTPRLTFPKIGIEFDQARNAGFSEGSGNPGRNDPCGTSGCGGTVGYNSHAAIVYWGHDIASAADGVTLPDNDDNVHGFPTPGSQGSTLRPAPQNPNNIAASSPGIAFVNLRGQTSQGGDSYLYHARIEVANLAQTNTLGDVRTASVANVDLANPGATAGGVSLVANDRILLTAQTSTAENGIYVWHSPATPLTRSADADSAAELAQATVRVGDGINIGSDWRQTASITNVDVDAQSWQPFVRDILTQVWIERDSGTSAQLIAALQDTTRPMSQLYPGYAPKLSDTATIYDVVGGSCGSGCTKDNNANASWRALAPLT